MFIVFKGLGFIDLYDLLLTYFILSQWVFHCPGEAGTGFRSFFPPLPVMCRWNSHYFTECIIEHTSGSEPATLVKLGDIALVVVYQVLGVKDAVFVQQVFIVAFKVMIDDIWQVGSIRAGCNKRILRWLSMVFEKEMQFGIFPLFCIDSI